MDTQNTMIRDLTEGSVFRKLIRFALPYMAANLLNTLYTLVDLAIIGRFTSSAGVSAVANAGNITMLLYAVGVGLGAGGGIFVAQLVGAKRYKDLNETIGTLLTFSAICGITLLLIGMALARPIVNLLNTPVEAADYAVVYLRICCIGMPFTFCFGNFSDMLRGMGDSLHPLVISFFMMLLNTVLDLLFVAVFQWGPAGAAIATSFSQICSLVFAWIFLYRRREQFHFDFKRQSFAMKADKLRVAVTLSIPLICMSIAINVSMMFVNSYVNTYGVIASAVAGIGGKLTSISHIVTSSTQNATSAMVGQNMGAGKIDRAKKTVYTAWGICLIFFALIGTACLTIPDHIFRIFSNDPAVIDLSWAFMRITFWQFLSFSLMSPVLGLINGVGFTLLNMIIAILDGVIARIGLSLLFGITMGMGLEGFWWGNALAGFVSVILAAVYFFSGRWQSRRLLKDDA